MRHASFILGTKMLSIVMALCLVFPLFNTGVQGQTVFVESLIKETGDIEAFGGGEYIGIRFGTEALFAVVYGTDENPNSPVIFVSINRYLGKANVTDTNNASLAVEKPLAVRTVYAVRLAALFEFNDTNDDGICNLIRFADGLSAVAFQDHEPIYKAVDLNTSWKPGNVKAAANNTERWKSWEFTITARNLSYIPIGNVNTTGKLDLLQFRFKLMAYIEDATYTIPQYNLRVTASSADGSDEPPEILDTESTGEEEIDGKVLRYKSKVDHVIEGWDFDPTNDDPGLLLETHSILGNVVSTAMLKWINLQFLQDEDRTGTMEYETSVGNETVDEADTTLMYTNQQPRKLKHPRLDVNDAWGRFSRFSWVKNVTVTRDGNTTDEEMFYQVQGGRKFAWLGNEGLFTGYYVVGGFSYPGGDRIVHDPELSISNFYQENAREEASDEGYDMVMPILFMIFVIVMAPIVILLFKKF